MPLCFFCCIHVFNAIYIVCTELYRLSVLSNTLCSTVDQLQAQVASLTTTVPSASQDYIYIPWAGNKFNLAEVTD